MSTLQRIEDYFSPELLIALCEDEFGPLAEQIAFNMQTKRTTSGARVNALDLPAETTGATAASLHTQTETTSEGFTVSFVGRRGIAALDEGQSPQQVQEAFGSFEAFLAAIERWARAKESRWMLSPGEIDAYGVASNIWDKGTVLYSDGGGTEIMKELLPPVMERISAKVTEVLDETIYKLLDATIEA